MTLAAQQRRVLEGLTAFGERIPHAPHGVFAPPSSDPLAARWHVYASGYLARIVEALANDYPALCRVLGDRAFRSLSARYARSCPPRSFDIGRVGDRLSDFLEGDPLTRGLPFLPDLARFEWAVSEAFVAPDDEPLAWTDLAVMGPQAVADLELRLCAGARVLRSPWPLFDLRDCHERADDEIAIPVEGLPLDALVFRRGFEVLRRRLDALDLGLLERAVHGVSLAQLASDPAMCDRVDALTERFRNWVVEGVFRRPERAPSAAPDCPRGG